MLLRQCVVSIQLLTVEMFSTEAMFRSARRHATTGLANKARLNPKEILSLYISRPGNLLGNVYQKNYVQLIY